MFSWCWYSFYNSYCAKDADEKIWFSDTSSSWKSTELKHFCILLISGEEFSNELPSSSSASSPPSTPSLSSSSSSSDLPHSPFLPHPEPPLNPVAPGNLRLEVAAPHYHENQLQVKVFWKLPNHGESMWTTHIWAVLRKAKKTFRQQKCKHDEALMVCG